MDSLLSLSALGQKLLTTEDERTLARAVAHAGVVLLADVCLVDVTDADGMVRCVATGHTDPARAEILKCLAERSRDRGRVSPHLLDITQPIVHEVASEVLLSTLACNDRELAALLGEGGVSCIVTPLLAGHGRRVGVLTLLAGAQRGPFQDRDVVVAKDIAWRAAITIDALRMAAETRKAARRADEANQAKTDFLATISHELRTPLNAVLGYTDLLLGGVPARLSPAARAHVERIHVAARQLTQLIEEVLSFTRLDGERERVHLALVEPATLLREVETILRPVAHAKGLELATALDAGAPAFVTDASKVRQMVVNLVTNAVKFTDRGRVTITLRADGQSVGIDVADTGVGIEAAYLEDIFDPFWKIHYRPTVEGGTGLGLTVTRQLARLLGGDVSVTSMPGLGSTFTIRLPMRSLPARR